MYCNKPCIYPSKHTPHVDDRRGHGGEHDGAEKAERVDLKSRRPGGRQQMIDPRKEDEDEGIHNAEDLGEMPALNERDVSQVAEPVASMPTETLPGRPLARPRAAGDASLTRAGPFLSYDDACTSFYPIFLS